MSMFTLAFTRFFAMFAALFAAGEHAASALNNITIVLDESSGTYVDKTRADRQAAIRAIKHKMDQEQLANSQPHLAIAP